MCSRMPGSAGARGARPGARRKRRQARVMLACVLSDGLGMQARAVRGWEHDVKEGKRA